MSAFISQSSCLSDRKHEKFIFGVFKCWKWTSNVSVRIESDEWFNEINSILVVLNVLASFYLSRKNSNIHRNEQKIQEIEVDFRLFSQF